MIMQPLLENRRRITSFGNVYQWSTNQDNLLEAAAQAKEAITNVPDPASTQFEINTIQLKQDRQKELNNGPHSTDMYMSMSIAAKTSYWQ
jgi:hypothetical protein